ncbi:MAG: hypothetical protein MJ180_06090, partial [Candidatus Gastranaerophilales bacterium]|nr:hypothetical protein [Candidatus Gastranaerophilales bacterium]
MDNKKKLLLFIFVVIIASAWVVFTRPIKKGLDLVGGSRITLEAQTTDTIAQITPDMMDSLKFAIEKRVNSLGISEVPVQKAGENRLIIEIPNVADPEQARAYVGDTAELEFKEPKEVAGGGIEWVSTGLTGNDLRKANVETDTAGQWVVSLEFNDKGTMKFAELTKRLVGKQMAIFFNGKEESAPVIREPITAGRAQISGGADGGFPYEEAKQMVDLLNAGALPVPAKIIEENVVGPTLGADSIDKSKTAGVVGLGLVAIFMLLLYRVPGMIAN